jgi:hypothetical protein
MLFNPANVCHARSLMQQGRQLVQLIRRPDCVDLNPSVIFIPDPSAQAYPGSALFDKPPEPDALHPAGDKPPASLGASLQFSEPFFGSLFGWVMAPFFGFSAS